MGLNFCHNCARDCDYQEGTNSNTNSLYIWDSPKNVNKNDSTNSSSKKNYQSHKHSNKKVKLENFKFIILIG